MFREIVAIIVLLYFAVLVWIYYSAFRRHQSYLYQYFYAHCFHGSDLKKWTGSAYKTLFFAGNGDCASQAAYYAGGEGINGTKAYPSIRTLINPEVQDPFDVERGLIAWIAYPFYLLIYPFLHSGRPIWPIQKFKPYWTNPRKINIAQRDDLMAAARWIESTKGDIILYGVSRGASVVVSVLSLLSEESKGRIKLVVAESPFDSVEQVMKNRPSWGRRLLMWILLKIGRYQPSGASPLSLVPILPKSIPIVIIASEKDDNVGYKSTMNLYRTLRDHVQRIDLITLKESSHGGYSGDDCNEVIWYYQKLVKIYEEVL